MRATLTSKDFFLDNFYLPCPFTFIFFQNLSRLFPVLAVANAGFCVGSQNKLGHPARRNKQLVPVMSARGI